MLMVVGASDTVSMVVCQTIRQLTTPDEMRGRMTAVGMLFFAGGPLSVAAGGLACVLMVVILSAVAPYLRTYDGA
jgi:hypothetical protein